MASRPGASALAIRRSIPAFCMSARDRVATPGYWIFTATRRPSGSTARCTWPIEAAAAASCVEVLEQLLDGLVPLLVEHLATFFHGIVRRLGAQLASLLLVELAVLGRQELGVDERGELADLHRCALHAPERLDHPLGGLEVAPLQSVGGLARGERARLRARVPA